MGILSWIVVGLVVGALARLVMPGKDPGGFIVTLLLGVIGAFVGGLLGNWLLGEGLGGFFSLRTWVLGIIGSVILLALYRLVAGRKAISG